MPINPNCDFCKKELEDFGGILLSPPDQDNRVVKYHICKVCYENLASEKHL